MNLCREPAVCVFRRLKNISLTVFKEYKHIC